MLLKKILKDRSFQISILLTLLFLGIGIIFLFAGWADYGWFLFIFLPILLGISLGAMPGKKSIIAGAIVTTLLLLLGLYVPGLSGILCIVMCIPIIVAFIFAGYVLMYLFKKYRNIKSTNRLSVLLLPLLPFIIFAPLERSLLVEKKQISEVSTERIFAYSPVQVFDAIKSVDTLDAIKPYLMKFDLPIPIKCILEKEEVGGIRICYFKSGRFSNGEFGSGTITERITEIKRGEVLKMDVIGYNLVGRKWIGFKEAVYYFNAMPDGKCKLTRITTYTSELRPRFYWAPLEKLGIVQEHDYVFSNLQKDLMQRYGR